MNSRPSWNLREENSVLHFHWLKCEQPPPFSQSEKKNTGPRDCVAERVKQKQRHLSGVCWNRERVIEAWWETAGDCTVS